MLFNSFEFIMVYIPITLSGLFILARWRREWTVPWLLVASIVFYGGWASHYIPLLLGSVAFNFIMGRQISISAMKGDDRNAAISLWSSIAVNLFVLFYFKYTGFFAKDLLGLREVQLNISELPLGISFFTFTQIAFLVDARRGKTAELNFARYGLFVTYYPHLIAGPILHHREMMEQFERRSAFRFQGLDFAAGASLFAIGLAKKVLVADSLAPIADSVFSSAEHMAVTMVEAWTGALAYTLQLYFDFSGYSDMALGLALMMGIRMPLNFNSPYKARNIIDFWRRWHMTLSRFLRDYLYIPLGGSRRGPLRRWANLMITMVLGGLWHGAGWTFLIWGGLHGLYLISNHVWRGAALKFRLRCPASLAWALTFLCVVVAWVFFRAESLPKALAMTGAMFGANGLALPAPMASVLALALGEWVRSGGTFGSGLFQATEAVPLIIVAFTIAIAAPNSQELMARYRPALSESPIVRRRMAWRPTMAWGTVIGIVFALSILMIGGPSAFLYFRF